MQTTATPPRKQNSLVFYLRSLLYMLMALALRIIVFVPLLALFYFPEESPLRWLAVLCPVLFVFFLLPLRFSFADALVQPAGTRHFAFDTAFGFRRYGEKLGESLLHALNILKWCIPLAAAGYYAYAQKDAGLSGIIGSVTALGVWVGNALSAIGSFFNHLFGYMEPVVIRGGVAEGLWAILGILGLCILLALIGMMRNSATRYVWAYANHNDRSTRMENRRRVKRRRFLQLVFALVNLLLWVPFLYKMYLFIPTIADEVRLKVMDFLANRNLDFSFFAGKIGDLLFAFFVAYLPFLPLRRILTAYYAAKQIGKQTLAAAPLSAATTPAAPAIASSVAHSPAQEPEEGLPPVSFQSPNPAPVPAWPPQSDSPYSFGSAPTPVAETSPQAVAEAPATTEETSSPWPPFYAAQEPYAPPETAAEPMVVPTEEPATESYDEPVAVEPVAVEPPLETVFESAAEPAPSSPWEPSASALDSADTLFGGHNPDQDEQPRQDVDPSAFTIGQ